MSKHEFVHGVCVRCYCSEGAVSIFGVSCVEAKEPWIGINSRIRTCDEGSSQKSSELWELRKAVRLHPTDVEAWKSLGDEYKFMDRFADAAAAYGEAVRLKPEDIEAQSKLGDADSYIGKYAEAISAYRVVLRQQPRNANLWTEIAEAYSSMRDCDDEAIASLHEALRLDPCYARAWDKLSGLHMTKGRQVDAIQACIKAIAGYRQISRDMNTSIMEFPMYSCVSRLARAYRMEGQYAQALSTYREAIRTHSEGLCLAWLWNELAGFYNAREQFSDAIAAYQETVRLVPDQYWALTKLGALLGQRGQDVEASAVNKRALAAIMEAIRAGLKEPWVSLHRCAIGSIYIRLGMTTEANAVYEGVIGNCKTFLRDNPNSPQAHHNLGEAFLELGRHDEAVAAFREAIGLDPKNVDWWKELGVLYGRLGQHKKAFAALTETMRLAPQGDDARKGWKEAYGEQGFPPEAIEAFQEAIQSSPDDAAAWHCMALGDESQHRITNALTAYREVIRLKPDDPWAHTRFGDILQRLHQNGDAAIVLRKAVELKPDYAEAWCALGRAYAAQGNRGRLMEVYERLKLLDKTTAETLFREAVIP